MGFNAVRQRAYRAEKRSAGICPVNGCRRLRDGWGCLEHSAEQRKRAVERYTRLRRKSRCGECGAPARPGLTTCAACATTRSRRAKRWRLARKALGLCRQGGCGASADPDHTLCRRHREALAEWRRQHRNRGRP